MPKKYKHVYVTGRGLVRVAKKEQTGEGFIDILKPALSKLAESALSSGAQALGSKVGTVVADKIASKLPATAPAVTTAPDIDMIEKLMQRVSLEVNNRKGSGFVRIKKSNAK